MREVRICEDVHLHFLYTHRNARSLFCIKKQYERRFTTSLILLPITFG